MAQAVSGGSAQKDPLKGLREEKIKAIVVTDVKIIEREQEVIVPKFVERQVTVPKYVNKEILVHDVQVVPTVVHTETVKVVEKEYEVEKPVFKDVVIEVPKYKTKEIIEPVVIRKEIEVEVPRVIEKIKVVEKPYEVKTYKLVEEIIKVPKIKYIPTEVERIVWKDVPRERCKHCNREIE